MRGQLKRLNPFKSLTASLMVADCLNTITNIFITTFLVAYFFKTADQNVWAISFYFMMFYGAVLSLAYLTGNIIKKGYRLFLYRIGIVTNFFALGLIMVLKEDVINYLPVSALLLGSATALKAFTWNLMVSENISRAKMISFRGVLNTIKGAVKILSPVVLGYFLTVDSISNTILFLLFLMIFELLLTVRFRMPKPKRKVKFSLWRYYKRTKKDRIVNNLYRMEFFNGLSLIGSLNAIVTLYIVYLFKTDFKLGIITAVFNFIALLTNLLFAKYGSYTKFTSLISWSFLMAFVGTVLFVIAPEKGTFIFYNFCCASAVKLFDLTAEVNMFNTANIQTIRRRFKTEYFALREMFLNVGRITSFAILLICSALWGFESLKYFILLLLFFWFGMGLNAFLLNKKLLKEEW